MAAIFDSPNIIWNFIYIYIFRRDNYLMEWNFVDIEYNREIISILSCYIN